MKIKKKTNLDQQRFMVGFQDETSLSIALNHVSFFIYTDKFNTPINRIKEMLTIFTVWW